MAKDERVERLPKKAYEAELFRLQGELVKLQEWVRTEGARLAVVFEGRDAAGKGSTIKRVSEFLNPRLARITALPAPTEREKSQMYVQRYVPQSGHCNIPQGAVVQGMKDLWQWKRRGVRPQAGLSPDGR